MFFSAGKVKLLHRVKFGGQQSVTLELLLSDQEIADLPGQYWSLIKDQISVSFLFFCFFFQQLQGHQSVKLTTFAFRSC